MDAVKITELYKGNQLEELQAWLDMETPYDDNSNWNRSPDGSHMVKMCEELNTLHKMLTDKARDTFAVHNLLPTFATINWYEPGVQKNMHYDNGPVEYTILYNYFSDNELELIYNEEKLTVAQGEAVAYVGSDFEHMVTATNGVSVRLNFNFAKPDNYYFVLGNHTVDGFQFPSGRTEQEVDRDWL